MIQNQEISWLKLRSLHEEYSDVWIHLLPNIKNLVEIYTMIIPILMMMNSFNFFKEDSEMYLNNYYKMLVYILNNNLQIILNNNLQIIFNNNLQIILIKYNLHVLFNKTLLLLTSKLNLNLVLVYKMKLIFHHFTMNMVMTVSIFV